MGVTFYSVQCTRLDIVYHMTTEPVQAALQGLAEESGSMQSSLLRSLVTPGEGFPDPSGPLQKLLEAADWDAAADEGRIRPCRVSLNLKHDHGQSL